MVYWCKYVSPDNFDNIILASDGQFLTNLFFEDLSNVVKAETDVKLHANVNLNENVNINANRQFYAYDKFKKMEGPFLPIFEQSFRWLDVYFSGKKPSFTPPYCMKDLSPFRKSVQSHVLEIPWGKTASYSDIAKKIAVENGIAKMSAQAVGGAAGRNPICIIIPCHRIVGAGGKIGGYSGGIKNKIELLKLEGIEH